ncbi:putative methylenetetrahydrofolate reductase [Emiliania huxleyi CCMP1516]|uniref:Methylenetetrahydrofolate reductase (NAD(P)H) n=2 Tax=Emiliania huxleyi TaxID=2903 RepID=A0A0D3IHJ8_EMIH1|nr:putative methylenetetrahydrofolate reductase [Emiliania huxleyi CCMP1516]EOD10733.1 putative methylenetetrahydrofolate reductase [Emiliania huxleyi CCMP1516]|eukprot:XP_005763162.1 putative methylenetetrahydrofolate reductase [Emiliania huxleyi CCMP1516]
MSSTDTAGNPTDCRGQLPAVKNGKIIDMVNAWTAATDQPFISFEYFPPKTPEGVVKLHKVIDEMCKQKPLFVDFTWGAGGSSADLTLELSKTSQQKHNVMVNMHLTCTNQSKEVCDAGLAGAKEAGICNIVALRGDPPKGQDKWEVTEGGFACALDLVKYMRTNYGDYFSIQVAGYPEGHPDRITKVSEMSRPLSDREKMRLVDVDGEEFVCTDENYAIELDYLKQKCDAGGDVIITQLFYDFEVFKAWVQDLRDAGITAPIFPGIMPLNACGGFKRMTGFCKTRIPPAMAKRVAELSGDDKKAEFAEYGIDYLTDLCKQLVASKLVPGLHFYALNQSERTFQILKRLGYYAPTD